VFIGFSPLHQLDEPNSFKRRLRCAAAFPASFENSPVGNTKESSNDIAVPSKKGWQAGDKRTINRGRVEENRGCRRAAILDKRRSRRCASQARKRLHGKGRVN
jgi:hypothetical protein